MSPTFSDIPSIKITCSLHGLIPFDDGFSSDPAFVYEGDGVWSIDPKDLICSKCSDEDRATAYQTEVVQ